MSAKRGDCAIAFTVSGNSGTLDDGQTCLQGNVTRGSLTLDGATLCTTQRRERAAGSNSTCTLVDERGALTKG